MKNNKEDTIFALSTPYGQSAVAVIRISGTMCRNIAKKFCKSKKINPRKAEFTKFFDRKKKIIDSGIMIFFKSPFSFTGEDMLEIQCHGGISIINKILFELNFYDNCRPAKPGEFSKRAFLNKKNGLLHYEGLANLIESETENQRIIASKQTFGESENICKIWRNQLLECIALLDAAIDFSEENESFDIDQIKKTLNEIVRKATNTVKLAENSKEILYGTKVLIFGPPNSGKSSLFNYLSREDRAITSSKAGTTTDQNTNILEIAGVKTFIVDTAGLRITDKEVEKIGVERTKKAIELMHKFILVLSPDCFTQENCDLIIDALKNIDLKQTVLVYNKSDLAEFNEGKKRWMSEIYQLRDLKNISISCVFDSKNINKLINLNNFISKNLLTIDTLNNDDYFFSENRQIENVRQIITHTKDAIKHLNELEIAVDYLTKAVQVVDELFGKNDYEERLGYVFDKFCIGK